MILAGLIRKAREKRFRSARSKAALADKLGISKEFLRRLELGESYPSGELLEAIVHATRMSGQDASLCWEDLAQHQLDEVTRRHVVLYGTRTPKLPPDLMQAVVDRITDASLEWVGMHYGVSDLDLARMREEITARLEGK